MYPPRSPSPKRLGGQRNLLCPPKFLLFAFALLLVSVGANIYFTGSDRKTSIEVNDRVSLRGPVSRENEGHHGGDFDSGFPDAFGAGNVAAESLASNYQVDERIAGLRLRLTAIANEGDLTARERLLHLAIDSINGSVNLKAIRLVQHCEDSDCRAELLSRMIRWWVERDPEDASHAIEELSVPLREELVNALAAVWANSDLPAAAAWAQEIPDAAMRVRATLAVANEAVRIDPFQSLELVSDLPPGSLRDELVLRATIEWSARETKPALAWARQFENGPLREQLIAGIAVSWAETDPIDAGRLVLNDLEKGRLQCDSVVGIAQRWAQQSPEQAAAWIEQFPPGVLKFAAADNVAKVWAQHSPSKAREWRARVGAE